MSYRKFFTPNGDGINDKWKIDFSNLEPGIKVYIFDRYGKLLTGLDSASAGWDGTYNGEMMPSTDYWFVVDRTDGRVHKGHFAFETLSFSIYLGNKKSPISKKRNWTFFYVMKNQTSQSNFLKLQSFEFLKFLRKSE